MSERILRALMQLFAIVAKVDEVSEEVQSSVNFQIQSTRGREIIASFLKSELSSSDVQKYLEIFEGFLNETRGRLYAKSGGKKRRSLQSVKVLRICEQINKELTQRQKFIVLIRIFEFIYADNHQSEKEHEFIRTVSDSFHISEEEFNLIQRFTEADGDDIIDEKNHVYYTGGVNFDLEHAHSGVLDGLDGLIHAIKISSVRTIFFKYFGKEELYINGLVVANDKTHLFNVGSTIKTTKSVQLFYSDLISRVSDGTSQKKISFEVNHVEHRFKSGREALRELSFATREGQLLGIMGGSGTGKTTLLNIMNGKVKPSSGSVLVNGIDLHDNKRKLEGMIGNVSQRDILIEELTVFENLYYSAKLSLKGLNKAQITKKVIEVLQSLGLYEIRNLRVGSVLEKIISGGQRKRLNIALELIREPDILFVDEPTSGLSSRDSENIMDLLKELALSGKIVFVVIHQPSSNIFKLFDRLFIMDDGGYIVYDGFPLNAIVHFKTYSYHGNSHERECSVCGNVNPEQIFNIIDAKIVNEYGNETDQRKRSPRDWHELYLKHRPENNFEEVNTPPSSDSRLPSKFQQYISYLIRDFKSKSSNVQYIAVNSLVAPALALLLSFFIKYFSLSDGQEMYNFFGNQNIPQYLFIGVIVAIFLGLTIAAEEINKDKQILMREKFLNLSRQSYLLSKVTVLFAISAIQTALFVLIGNSILEIQEMWWQYWLVLFSTACVSNLVGLNISSAFNSAKVIYIIVPLLIIPQLLFSGVIVKFDKLHPSLSDATKVPWVGNMMVSRWAYEALAVEQSANNKLEKNYFVSKINHSAAQWKKDYWIPEVKSHLSRINTASDLNAQDIQSSILTVKNEIEREDKFWSNLNCPNCLEDLDLLKNGKRIPLDNIEQFIDVIKLQSINTINKENDRIQAFIDSIGSDKYKAFKKQYINESLSDLTTNRLEENKIILLNNRLYQNDDPIYHDPKGTPFLETHFYAPYKYIFGKKYDTYTINLIAIWVISIITYIILYFDLIRKLVELFSLISQRLKTKKGTT